MYSTHLCSGILLITLQGYGQKADTLFHRNKMPFVYLEAGIGYSNGLMFNIKGNLILSNNWGLNGGYSQYNRISKNMPSDYGCLLCYPEIGLFIPTDRIFSTTVRLSRVFNTRSQLIRFKIEGGAAFIQYEPVHFYLSQSGGWFVSKYEYYHSYHRTTGVSFRAVAEFPHFQCFGTQIAILGTYTDYVSYVAVELNMMMGYVREKTHLPGSKDNDK